MNRPVLASEKISPEALQAISGFHTNVVKEVADAVASQRVVIVGMAHNPFVGKARKALSKAGVKYSYLEYGSYFSGWKQRLAIKLWSGWPTFPQVFVDGKLVGGFTDTARQLEKGLIKP